MYIKDFQTNILTFFEDTEENFLHYENGELGELYKGEIQEFNGLLYPKNIIPAETFFVIDDNTKIINVWQNNLINRERLATINYGVIEYFGEVEEYNNFLYAKGFAPQISIEELKLQKEDEINQACEKNITSGFWYKHSSQETELHFSFDSIDQTNFLATADIVKDKRAGLAPAWVPDVVEWKGWKNVPHTELVNLILTLDGFTELNYAAKLHQLTNQTKAGQLKNLVYEATTKEELEAIKWE